LKPSKLPVQAPVLVELELLEELEELDEDDELELLEELLELDELDFDDELELLTELLLDELLLPPPTHTRIEPLLEEFASTPQWSRLDTLFCSERKAKFVPTVCSTPLGPVT
jgi:hypothetical protein